MGTGTNWFKRELGKNTGKYVSTKLFGDKHATPHKIIIAREDSKIEKQNAQNSIKSEAEKLKIETKRTEVQHKAEIEKLEVQQMGTLIEKKEFILTKTLPNDKDEIFDFGNYLITEIKSNGWSGKAENAHINSFSDVCLNKLSQCKIKLDSLGATFESEHFGKELKSLKNKKLFQNYAFFGLMGILGIIFFICHKLGLIK